MIVAVVFGPLSLPEVSTHVGLGLAQVMAGSAARTLCSVIG